MTKHYRKIRRAKDRWERDKSYELLWTWKKKMFPRSAGALNLSHATVEHIINRAKYISEDIPFFLSPWKIPDLFRGFTTWISQFCRVSESKLRLGLAITIRFECEACPIQKENKMRKFYFGNREQKENRMNRANSGYLFRNGHRRKFHHIWWHFVFAR